jgi:hypothetical protein
VEELDEQQLEQMSGGATIPVRRKKVPSPGWYEC